MANITHVNAVDRRTFLATLAVGVATSGCVSMPGGAGWTTLVDGATMTDLSGFTELGTGGWSIVDGALQGKGGKLGYLVTKDTYTNFEIRAEFWADEDANSGIFIRMQDIKTVTAANSYEVNIFDKRPGQDYSTGAIVDVAKVDLPAPKAAGQWNVYEITAKGSQLTVVLNGKQTVNVQNNKHARGPFSLQYAPGVVKDKGVIKFRKVQVQAL